MATNTADLIPKDAKPQGLLPVENPRIYRGRDGVMAEKMRRDVTGWGLNEVRKLLVDIAADETQDQIALGNPPAFVNVDGMAQRSITAARRRITVSYGQRLTMAALNELHRGLMHAIAASTTARTGTLSSPSNWKFRYVHNGHAQDLALVGTAGIPMGPGDFIVLMPQLVRNASGQAYATAANMRVAGGGKLSFRRSARSKVTRKNQSIGFLALAARAAQASPAFGGFKVSAGFTTKHALAGEVVHRGGGQRTGFIKVRPSVGKYRF